MQIEPIFQAVLEEQNANPKNQLADSSSAEAGEINFFQRSVTEHELENNIPVPLLKLARLLLSNQKFTSTVGIFRVNSTKAEEEHIERLLATKNYDKLAQVKDPFVISSNRHCFVPSQ